MTFATYQMLCSGIYDWLPSYTRSVVLKSSEFELESYRIPCQRNGTLFFIWVPPWKSGEITQSPPARPAAAQTGRPDGWKKTRRGKIQQCFLTKIAYCAKSLVPFKLPRVLVGICDQNVSANSILLPTLKKATEGFFSPFAHRP